MGGSSGSTSQSPWEGQQPYLSTGYEAAYNQLLAGGPGYFPGQQSVGFSPQTEAGLGQLEDSARAGNPVAAGAANYVSNTLGQQATDHGAGNFVQGQLNQGSPGFQGYAQQTSGSPNLQGNPQLQQTAGGDYLNSNPHLDGMYNNAARAMSRQFQETTAPSIGAQFSAAGRTGSNAHQEAFQRSSDTLQSGLGQLASNVYGNNYAQERQNQLGAANSLNQTGLASSGQDISRLGLAGNLAGQDQSAQLGAANLGAGLQGQTLGAQKDAAALSPVAYDLSNADANQLLSVGSAVENKAQQYVNDDVNRWDFTQQQPYDNLQNYLANIGGNVGFEQQTSGGGSKLGTAAGGALTGYQVGGPWGALIGGALGYFGGGN